MRILNLIYIKNNNVEFIKSFPIIEGQFSGDVIKEVLLEFQEAIYSIYMEIYRVKDFSKEDIDKRIFYDLSPYDELCLETANFSSKNCGYILNDTFNLNTIYS